MPRAARQQVAAGYYHVTTRGNGQQPIFLDDIDRMYLLTFLNRVVKRELWNCLAYCLMTSHYHVVIDAPAATLSRGMKYLNGVYAQTFNGRHGRRGHVFGERYRLTSIESDDHLGEACRYVVCNPIRAGMCDHPRDWPWSSYRATAGEEAAPPFLNADAVTGLFGNGEAGYIGYVEEALQKEGQTPRGSVPCLGSGA